ncbi:hypothetical protein [Ilumatobacter sp.]|uniref:F0F1 ATP synthase subunit B family protein n=1 Tax=Ilumatobacter sp. TaxID=1967498 RepID=UPI003B52577A
MLTAVVTTSHSSGLVQVSLLEAEGGQCERTDLDGNPEFAFTSEDCPELNPIAPEPKEMIWGFGAFVVLAVCLRYWLFPKVREGMTARYEHIRSDRESADTLTAAARADVAEYEARLTSVRAEAQQKVDAARETLESERGERLAEVNERTAAKRAAAQDEVEQARQAAMGDVESAVTEVVRRATELATGRRPDDSAVRSAVQRSMGASTTGAGS